MTKALYSQHLLNQLEVTYEYDLYILRPVITVPIKYGYPYAGSSRDSLSASTSNCTSGLTPSEHVCWATTTYFHVKGHPILPTMLQGTTAIHRVALEDLRLLREHNLDVLASRFPCYPTTDAKINHWRCDNIQFMIDLTHYIDKDIVHSLEHGFPLTGNIPCGGLFEDAPHPKIAKLHPSDLKSSSRDIERLLQYLRGPINAVVDLRAAVAQDVVDEALKLRALGPLPIDHTFDSDFFVSPIFGIQQSDKIRLISNYAFRSHGVRLNDAATVMHKVSMPRMSHVAEVVRLLGLGPKHISRTDHESAYRQLKVLPEDQVRATGLYMDSSMVPHFVVPLVCPFGAVASVTNYLRCSEMHCHFIRSIGFCNALAYMDDCFPVEYPSLSTSAVTFINFINERITGGIIKHSKDVAPSTTNALLGFNVDLSQGGFIVSLTDQRRAKILLDLSMATRDHSLISSKMAGKLSFACEALYGRVGRGYVRTLIRQSRGFQVDTASVDNALAALIELFTIRSVPKDLVDELHSDSPPVVCYSDASGDGRLGIFIPSMFNVPGCWGTIKVPYSEGIHINMLEFLAAAITVDVAARRFCGKLIILFTDNTTVEYLVHKGSSSSQIMNEAVAKFWIHLAFSGVYHLLTFHVPSTSNPADPISRDTFSVSWLLGSEQINLSLPNWWASVQHHQFTIT